ncbi:MAG: RNA polymerase sigma factor [Myxococcales bacterium]|nr:RNA polymerase sigma factor [Myxococcales bacterium]
MQGQAIEQLYAAHGPAIEAHCCQLVGDSDGADALQETFVRVLTWNERPRSDDHLVRSLFRISTNVCIDVLRKRGVRHRAAPELLAVQREPIHVQDGAHHARDSLRQVLARCDDTTCSIVALCFIDGMRRQEAAEALGTTRRTVFNRLEKVKRLAGELLAEG